MPAKNKAWTLKDQVSMLAMLTFSKNTIFNSYIENKHDPLVYMHYLIYNPHKNTVQ